MDHASISIPSGLKVMIGIPVGRDLPKETVLSLFATGVQCHKMGIETRLSMTSAVTQLARNLVLAEFLKSDCDRLFWIDSDMVWDPADFLRLVALSTVKHVICCTYPAKIEGPLTYLVNVPPGSPVEEYGLVRCNGAGLGFCIMDREAAEAVSAMHPMVTDQMNGAEYRAVFRFDVHEGHFRTEDIAFMADLNSVGMQVWLDPHVALGHMGMRQWHGKAADAFVEVDDEAAAA